MANTFGSLPGNGFDEESADFKVFFLDFNIFRSSIFRTNAKGFIGPAVTGLLLSLFSGITGWFIVFWLTAIVYFVGAAAFLIFGTSEAQKWAKNHDNK